MNDPPDSDALGQLADPTRLAVHDALNNPTETRPALLEQCAKYARSTRIPFGRVGVHFARNIVGELLLGMRWQHLHFFATHRLGC